MSEDKPRRRTKWFRRLKRTAIGLGVFILLLVLVPVLYIEAGCRPGGTSGTPYRAMLKGQDTRPEMRTWLTYPEWHIVYSADSFGQFLKTKPPSAFPYFRHIGQFWSGFCALNQESEGGEGTGSAKVMIYTIGISYTVELGVKAIYENSIGRLSEWIGGWKSADDAYAQYTQERYGAFMHEVPWYKFPFGDAFSNLWKVRDPDNRFRHIERRLALSAEYGVKNIYAGVIGSASGAALGADERQLRMVVTGQVAAIDPRLTELGPVGNGMIKVDAPRYAQFTDLVGKLADSPVNIVEIAGNDDIFVTVHLPAGKHSKIANAKTIIVMQLDKPGMERVGVALKVSDLLGYVRAVRAAGGSVEHVYDY